MFHALFPSNRRPFLDSIPQPIATEHARHVKAEPQPPAPLAERTKFLEGDARAASKVEAFLAKALTASGGDVTTTAGALVPWICDALALQPLGQAESRDLAPTSSGICRPRALIRCTSPPTMSSSTRRARLEAGLKPATVERRHSVLRGTYQQLAAKGLVSWETARDIAAIKMSGVQKNSTPSLTQRQAIDLLEAIPAVSRAARGARPGSDERVLPHRLPGASADVTPPPVSGIWRPTSRHCLHHREAEQEAAENPARRRPAGAGLCREGRHQGGDKEGPLFRPLTPDDSGFERRHMDHHHPDSWSRNTVRPPESIQTGWASGGSASIRYARPRSMTPFATGRRCTK